MKTLPLEVSRSAGTIFHKLFLTLLLVADHTIRLSASAMVKCLLRINKGVADLSSRTYSTPKKTCFGTGLAGTPELEVIVIGIVWIEDALWDREV